MFRSYKYINRKKYIQYILKRSQERPFLPKFLISCSSDCDDRLRRLQKRGPDFKINTTPKLIFHMYPTK